MTEPPKRYVSNRVLKLNVGFLLNTGPAHNHDSEIDFPAVRISDDLIANYIRGRLRLSRTKEGILVQANLRVQIADSCYRCLEPYPNELEIELEELFGYSTHRNTEFFIDEDGILDLAPLLRDEVIIEQGYGKPFRADGAGFCPMCGLQVRNKADQDDDDRIDPRMAELKKLLDSN